jgi:uncharacterized membrane protein SpoIIM required for sporulation
MKVAVLLEQRRADWNELDELCILVANSRRRDLSPEKVARFAQLYRAACADLALADAYQLPPSTVQYLHLLVGRAHNQLYRSRRFDFRAWYRTLFVDVPRQVFHDGCVRLALLLFWLTFLGSGVMAYYQSDWAEEVASAEMIEMLEENFKEPLGDRDPQMNFVMAGFYIRHNTSIGLRCFAWGTLIVPGLYETLSNALILGACFGFMARPDVPGGANFFEFVTAHGPFELNAIVLAAGAGLRIGMGWLKTDGLTRVASLQRATVQATPLMGTAMLMFFMAALIEGFLSPMSVPYFVKASVAIASTLIMFYYFVVLGFLRRAD